MQLNQRFLRIQKLEKIKSAESLKIHRDILDVFVYDAAFYIRKFGMDAVNSFAFGETRDLLIKGNRILYYCRGS